MENRKNRFRACLFVMAVALAAFSLFLDFSLAQTVVIGEGIRFSPLNPRPGQTVFMDLRFRVEGSGPSIPIDFSIIEASRTPDFSRPTLSGHRFAPRTDSYTISIGHRLPDPIPPRICFNVYAHFPGTGLRSALLVNNACLAARLHLAQPGTGHRVTAAVRGRPGEPTIIEGTIIGRHVDFAPANLNPGENTFYFVAVMDAEGEARGGELILVKEGYSIVSTSVGLDPGINRKPIPEILSCGSADTDLVPSKLNYDIKIRFPTYYDRTPPSFLLIEGIRLETLMYVVSEGMGQRITLPESKKMLPPAPGLKPARPKL